MAEQRAWFAARGIDIVVASFSTPERLRHYQEMKKWPFAIYADPERKVYNAFDLHRLPWWKLIGPRVLLKYLKLVFNGGRIQRTHGEDVMQGGGDFLVTLAGGLLYEFRSDNPADRPSMKDLKKAVERLPRAGN